MTEPQQGTEGEQAESAPPTGPHRRGLDDISGVDNMVEEGAPLEPFDSTQEPPFDSAQPSPDDLATDGDGDELEPTRRALAERTSDLQRLQAEYLNYKRRVDRDRELIRERATYAALEPMIDVLDTVDRAREHGELDPGFQAVADQVERVVAAKGLVKFGAVGDAFDPQLHQALSHIGTDPEVAVTTCKLIAKAGYRMGSRVVRPAQVLVVDPAEAATAPETPEPTDTAPSGDSGEPTSG